MPADDHRRFRLLTTWDEYAKCENYAVAPLFFLNFSLFIARPPVLGTTLNCIIMLS